MLLYPTPFPYNYLPSINTFVKAGAVLSDQKVWTLEVQVHVMAICPSHYENPEKKNNFSGLMDSDGYQLIQA